MQQEYAKQGIDKNVPAPGWASMQDEKPLQFFIKEHKLNEKQALAFLMIGQRFLLELKASHETAVGLQPPPVKQLLSYVGGVGGVGKSHVIKTTQALFAAYGKSDWLYIVAPTHAAANLLKGTTVHNGFGVSIDSKLVPPSPGMRRAKFVMIDEISMVSSKLFFLASASMNKHRGSPATTCFGGLHVVAFGDFYQLGPVGHLPLYQEKCQQSQDAHMRAGRSMWHEKFRTVIFLTEQMRQKADLEFARLLMNIREGRKDPKGLALLRSRIADRLPKA